MFRTMLKSKIHRATITEADVNYVGSITVDEDLMKAADMIEYERVQVVDVNNGARLETYVIPGPAGSGVVCVNGAAARLVTPGDKVIVMSYAMLEDAEARGMHPTVVFVDEANRSTHMGTSVTELGLDISAFDLA